MKINIYTFAFILLAVICSNSYGQRTDDLYYSRLSGDPAIRDIDPEYHTYQEIYDFLDSISEAYPDITHLDTSWTSQFMGLKIPVLKISDNAELEEDEPAIGYDGLIHSREPATGEICLQIIDHLLSNYGTDSLITYWIDNIEIFFIPMLNPDGWKYVVEVASSDPWWLKNQRDNDENGIFVPPCDGVDLNRNFDYCWLNGDPDPCSWKYRGPYAFSEKETQLKRKYASEQKYVMSINYHSFGQFVANYPDYEGNANPQWSLFCQIADSISGRIPNLATPGHYYVKNVPCDEGYGDCWMYVKNGTIEFGIETAHIFVPSGFLAMVIAEDNIPGALYLLERVLGPGITGHVVDAYTLEPLVAQVKVLEVYESFLEPRTSDSLYGRFYSMLSPGTYTLEISKEGYETVTIENIQVGGDSLSYRYIMLYPPISVKESFEGKDKISITPNPASGMVEFRFQAPRTERVKLILFDQHGREVANVADRLFKAGEQIIRFDAGVLAPGVYLCCLTTGSQHSNNKLVVVR